MIAQMLIYDWRGPGMTQREESFRKKELFGEKQIFLSKNNEEQLFKLEKNHSRQI